MAECRRRSGSVAILAAVIGLLAVTIGVLAAAGRPAPDRVQELAGQLRCPVCKSVSIADSPSDAATAMRQVVAEQVAAGRSDDEIIGYFRARYGDWVWLDPPAAGTTLLLWLLPGGAVVAGVVAVAIRVRDRTGAGGVELAGPDRALLDAAVTRARTAAHHDDEEGP